MEWLKIKQFNKKQIIINLLFEEEPQPRANLEIQKKKKLNLN